MSNRFDQKFGEAFLATVPDGPGVYEWLASDGSTLYVGKAVSLRRRIAQYRLAGGRKKVERKRWRLVKEAASLRFRPCESELAALLLENELIQTLRPPHNVSGVFSFMYPCLGVRRAGKDVDLCCTTSPDQLPDFEFSGAFRSPALTRAAFDALVGLLEYVGHREPSKRLTDVPKVDFTRVVRFRQLDPAWSEHLQAWWRGTSPAFLKALVLELLEQRAARRHADDTQEHLQLLRRFWEEECLPLRTAMSQVGRGHEPFLPQALRDPVFLAAKHR